MGKVKRYNPDDKSLLEWHNNMQSHLIKIDAEGQGRLEVDFFDPRIAVEEAMHADDDDVQARIQINVVGSMRQWINDAARGIRATPACIICDRPFTRRGKFPAVLAALHADIPTPEMGVISGACERCARYPDINTRITNIFLERLLPDGEVVPASQVSEPGHA